MQKIYWDLLKKNHEESKKRRIESLFESDENRFRKFSLKIEDLYFDYSKTNIDPLTLSNLIKFAENSEIVKNVDAMFNGDKINVTENRSVLHTALILLEILALGAAKGKSKFFNSFLATLCFGKRTAIVLLLLVTLFEILLFSFNSKTKVIGPGQNFEYRLKN